MTILFIPDEQKKISDQSQIKTYLNERGIRYEHWSLPEPLERDADQETVLTTYASKINPYMEKYGYQTADVICVSEETPNISEIRKKFLQEHTHSEDEVRLFAKGQGLFWFSIPGQAVFSLLCEEGDLISVPANFPHWFDLGEKPYVKAVRMFTDPAGWVANYTGSGVDGGYNRQVEQHGDLRSWM